MNNSQNTLIKNGRLKVFVFWVVIILSLFLVVVQIVNPHSFLSARGGFAAAFVFLAAGVIWYKISSGLRTKIPGLIAFLIIAALYFYYGVNAHNNNVYYEKNIKTLYNN